MKYVLLFSLEIVHDYYADQRCSDFLIIPTPDTQKLLKNVRCVLKSYSNRIEIWAPITDTGQPFVPLSADARFTFHLQLLNPDFALFTDTTEIGKMVSPLYTNTGADPKLSLVSRQAKSTENLVVSRPAAREQFILSGKPRPGLQSKDFVTEGLGAVSKPDAYDPDAKTITLNSTSGSMGTQFTVTYPVTPHLHRNVFADVEIDFQDTQMQNLDSEKNFKIIFNSKQVWWKYYLITDSKPFTPAIIEDIKDRDNLVKFRINNDEDDITKQLADQFPKEQFPNMRYFQFISDARIPCRQTIRKIIQLQMDKDKVVLPNPSYQNYTHKSNSETEQAVYHIVKYFLSKLPPTGGR
jgi:hypothetical protein